MLGIGMSEELKQNGFTAADEISPDDRNYIRDFNQISVFDYCVLLNESGRGIYSQGSYIKPINLYSSQAYVDCISSPDGSAISFISDPFSASGKDVVAFSCRAGSVILIGIYSQDSFEALYDSAIFGGQRLLYDHHGFRPDALQHPCVKGGGGIPEPVRVFPGKSQKRRFFHAGRPGQERL